MKKIPVVLAADENYAMPMCVTIMSILLNKDNDTFYDFYIMVPMDFSDMTKAKFLQLQDQYHDVAINFIDMKNMFADVEMSIAHITAPTYYRLIAASTLSLYDKCIYLDGDIIVAGNLRELYDIDIENNYIAGVKAAAYHARPNGNKYHCDVVGLTSIDQYVNAGVLVMNLKAIRDNRLETVFLELVNRRFPTQDQDILNLACYDHIKLLPLKYNVMTKYDPKNEEQLEQLKFVFSESDIKESYLAPHIIHYADKNKPWGVEHATMYGEIWWDCALRSPYRKELLSLLQTGFSKTNEMHENALACEKAKELAEEKLRKLEANIESFKIKQPKVSVVVPVYNGEKHILECINSLREQTLKEIEIICVNDGSTDATEYLLKKMATDDARMIVINQENQGAPVARNRGLELCTGECVCILDADDIYDKEMLYHMYQRYEKVNADVIVGRVQFLDNETREISSGDWALRKEWTPNRYVFSNKEMSEKIFQFSNGWSIDKLYKREYLEKHAFRFQNIKVFNDAFFVFSTLFNAERISVLDRVIVTKRRSVSDSISARREENWREFTKMIAQLHQALQNTATDIFNQSFLNYALHMGIYMLSCAQRDDVYEDIYRYLQSEYFGVYRFDEYPKSYFYNKAEYDKYLYVKNTPFEEVDLKGRVIGINGSQGNIKPMAASKNNKDIQQVNKEKAELMLACKNLEEEVLEQRKQIASLQKRLSKLKGIKKKYDKVVNSRAYKVGLKITFIPRKIKKLLKGRKRSGVV